MKIGIYDSDPHFQVDGRLDWMDILSTNLTTDTVKIHFVPYQYLG